MSSKLRNKAQISDFNEQKNTQQHQPPQGQNGTSQPIPESIWDNEDLPQITANVIQNHVEGLKGNTEAEDKAKQNPFPVEVFPQPIQEIITATNESLNFPVDFIGASILYAISVSIANTHRVEIMKGWKESAVIYLSLVGRAGTNKSHPISYALKPIEQRDKLQFQDYQSKKKEYEAISALTKKEREAQGFSEPVKPIWEQHLVTDFTPEALADVHKFNTRGVGVYVDELASWFKNFNRYNNGSEEQFWLSVWSGKPIRINRKTSEPTYIPLPFISVAGTIQPAVLNELADNRTENGFLDRLLFVVPDDLKKEYWSEKELNPSITESWQTIISNLLDVPISDDETGSPEPEILRFTPEAKGLLFEWQRDLTDQSNKPENEAVSGINAKIEMYAVRLALMLQMARYACNIGNKEAVGIEAVQGALTLVEYFRKTAIKVHSIVSNASPLDKIPIDKQKLYTALPDIFTTSEGVEFAEGMGINKRTFKRFLCNKDVFKCTRHGEYEKLF